MENKERLFDLSYLNQVFQGNKDMINQIIDLFLEQVPEYVSEMQSCVIRDQLEELHPLAHKAKSSVNILGLKGMETTILKIEYNSKHREEMEYLPVMVEELSRESKKAFEQLRAHLKS